MRACLVGALRPEAAVPFAAYYVADCPPRRPRGRGDPDGYALLSGNETAAEAILIVDDEESVLRLVRRILKPAGYVCVEAHDAISARELLAGDHSFALILCDVNMPGESGIELARDVAADYPDTAVVIVSGLDDPRIAATALELGAYGYVLKPFTANELLIYVANALRRRKLEIAERRHRDELEATLTERTAELRRLADELAASRARVVHAADESRRRLERDLHDGVQQRLVSVALALRGVTEMVPPELPELADQIREAADALGAAVRELQEVSRGIHPAILSKGGLGPAIKTLARRTAMPVELDFSTDGRWPERVEVAVYYVISEALTNAAKHADASLVQVSLQAENGALVAAINDDGVGGADPEQGSGLVGLRDRVESIGGTLQIDSREGRGTLLTARIPI